MLLSDMVDASNLLVRSEYLWPCGKTTCEARLEFKEDDAGPNPTLAGAAMIMDPWTATEVDARDTTALGYGYV
jgi:hypothetical protein